MAFRKEDLDKYRNKERLGAETYLASYVDFIKWTAAITIAAIAWLATASASQSGLPLVLTLGGLAGLVIALILAVLGLRSVLDASAYEWDLARLQHSFALHDLFETYGEDREFLERKKAELGERFRAISDRGDKFYGSTHFNRLMTWHVGMLSLSVLFYAAGQVAETLAT